MVKADLHVHSKASKRPSEWFLKKTGARESYTDIDTLYDHAKKCHMDFVTVTDHNTIEGALELVSKYPEDTFISVEVTTYFPEDRCKIHILVFDITPEQFAEIEALRHNIYCLREYIKERELACSVAHAFYSVNGKLSIEKLEKLLVLFDVFEGLNGARNRYHNETWQSILKQLTPARLQALSEKYNIRPMGDESWIKGFTGGSDDHAGLFIGRTATISDCPLSKDAFIQSIKDKKTDNIGRCNDYKSFAFSIYKIFCDYSSITRKNSPGKVMSFVNHAVFESQQNRLKQWIAMRKVKKVKQEKDRIILDFFEDVYHWSHGRRLGLEDKMESIYHSMGTLLDDFLKMLLESFVKDLSRGDIGRSLKNLMSALPALFICVPFFSSLRHLSQDRDLMVALDQKFNGHQPISDKKILWFTDTLTDLNGVSVTLRKFGREMKQRGLNVTFVTCRNENDDFSSETIEVMNLPCIYSFNPEFYKSYTVNFPSLLSSMEMIYQYQPDRIIVSTPGPVGMTGMTMANILGIECVSIYHTDFAAQAEWIFEDEAMAGVIQSLVNRFYAFSTMIKVPTREYMKILEQQNYDPQKMSLFKRGFTIKDDLPAASWKHSFLEEKGVKKGMTLIWAGRVSKDKNLEFLIDIYTRAQKEIKGLNLIICGDGPDLGYFKKTCRFRDRIYFTDRIDPKALEQYYRAADLLVFPSTTDTFGMVVLEAQAAGLPALVTDIGGPQEIIENKKTGQVLSLDQPQDWVDEIIRIHHMKNSRPGEFAGMQSACRSRIENNYDWDNALTDILGGFNDKQTAGSKTLPEKEDTPWAFVPSSVVWDRKKVVA